jgi:hypothetical protein
LFILETLHSKIEDGDTVLLTARDILEEEMFKLCGRKDGGRPFSLTTQLPPHTPILQRQGTTHSAPTDWTPLLGSPLR